MNQRAFGWTLVVIMAVCFFAFSRFPTRTLALSRDRPAPVDEQSNPARFGLPAKIEGYNVLAVLTPDNTACMLPGTMRIVLQTTQKNILSVPKADEAATIEKELRYYGISHDGLQVQMVGPAVSAQAILSENRVWNEKAKTSGCLQTTRQDTLPN